MKRPLLALTCGLSLALVSLSALPSKAQSQDPNQNANYQKNESSSIYGNNTQGFDPYTLIHNMRFGSHDPDQFRQESNSQIDNAAADYRTQLLQYWKQQKQNSIPATTTTQSAETTTMPTSMPK